MNQPITGHVKIECFGPDGKLKWTEEGPNRVPDAGINWFMENDAAAATLYVGLKNTGTVAAGDTMASHAGWTENVTYSDATRVAFTEDASSTDEAISNSGSPAAFSINGSTTIFGSFLTTDNTKSGSTGTLVSAKDFSGSQAVSDGDTLNVTHTVTGSSS